MVKPWYIFFQIIGIILFCIRVFATTFIVGNGQPYLSPNALYLANVVNHNDTIHIHNGTYSGTASLANWSKNNLYIKGINGRPHMKAAGQNIGGKAIWIVSGNNCKVENIEFSECAVPDQNGAGIRAEGIGITIRNCYFHNNENGILTNNNYAGHIDIQNSEFAYNGYGDGQSHNLYVGHVSKLTFMYNYSHHANVGHTLKSRANENYIAFNRIMDEETGNSSRLIDLSNGGLSILLGNLFMQGNLSPNNNLIGYGLEGLTNSLSEVYIVNNTLVNKRVASCVYIHLQSGTSIAMVVNNIFAGSGTMINGTATTVSNNYSTNNIADVQFVNEAIYDYRLSSTSPPIDDGMVLSNVHGYSLIPVQSYLHPTNYSIRTPNGMIDAGAYEYNLPCTTTYTTYIFDGAYNDQWNNSANWNNDCLPPSPYNGSIQIDANCITPVVGDFMLNPGASIIVQIGKSLMWKW